MCRNLTCLHSAGLREEFHTCSCANPHPLILNKRVLQPRLSWDGKPLSLVTQGQDREWSVLHTGQIMHCGLASLL
jgi:hypothetical protein